jgi:t-SNARE complex subunit (syntaxin)
MSKNQLAEFHAAAVAEPTTEVDHELDLSAELQPLNNYVDKIQKAKTDLEAAQDKHMELGSDTTKQAVAKKSREINDLVREALNSCSEYDTKTRKRFSEKKLTREEGEARLRQNALIRKKIVDLSKLTWKSQQDHRQDVTTQVARRVNERFDAAGQEKKSPEETQKIAQALIRSNRERMLFRLAILELEEAVREREAIDEIEQSVAELLQIMEEYRAALAEQTELVLHVEENVIKADKYTKKAEQQLKKAAKSSSCCCVVQ